MADKDPVLVNADANLHYLPKVNALVKSSGSVAPAKLPSSPEVVDQNGDQDVIFCGNDNNYFGFVVKTCSKNSIIPSTIEWQMRAIRSGGACYGTVTGYKDGVEIFEPADIPEVEEFKDRNDLDSYFEEALADTKWFNHAYAELGLDPNRSKFISICAQEASFMRLGLQNKDKNNAIEFVYLDANWPNGSAATWTKLPLIDTYWDPIQKVRDGKYYKYIYPTSVHSPGKVFYQVPSWHSIILGSWVDVANMIPEFKKYLMENQMNIKYLIHIPDTWWDWKYPGWIENKIPQEKKKEYEKAELVKFNDVLTGVKAAGKTLMMTFKTTSDGKEYAKWQLQVVEDKTMSGAYIEDSQEASSHILYALGVDGTLIGNSPGKGMGAGSGSDKRVAWNIMIMTSRPLQDKVLKPLNFISKYNGWKGKGGKPIVWRFNNYLIATLDQGKQIKPTGEN